MEFTGTEQNHTDDVPVWDEQEEREKLLSTLLVHPLNDFDYTDGNGMASMIMEATWNKDTSGRTLVLVVVVGGTLIQLNIDFILEGTK